MEGAADYAKGLEKHKVILDPAERAALIGEQAHALAKEHKLALVEDEALLTENAGLTEWPTVLIGTFDEAFLAVPAECLMLSMKQHQKCFSLKHPPPGTLANTFPLVSNLIAEDAASRSSPATRGDPRAAEHAKFFWEQDLKKPLDEMAVALAGITFMRSWAREGAREARRERRSRFGLGDAVPEDAGGRRSSPRPTWCRAWWASSLVAGAEGATPPRPAHQAGDRARHRAALQARGPRTRAAGIAGRRGGDCRGVGTSSTSGGLLASARSRRRAIISAAARGVGRDPIVLENDLRLRC